jgi:hypothetical protein
MIVTLGRVSMDLRTPINLAFGVTDQGGYPAWASEVQLWTDDGDYTSLKNGLDGRTSIDVHLAPGHTYRFRIRASGDAGNVGAWSYSRYQRTWARSGTHTILIRVLGTSGRPMVEYDEFDVLE